VQVSEPLQDYVHRLWQATARPAAAGVEIPGVDMQRLMAAPASPRAMSMLVRGARVVAWLDGRDYVIPEDVQAVWAPALKHRLFFEPVYEMRRGEIVGALVARIIERVAAP
jgi:MoxR-like ATPase